MMAKYFGVDLSHHQTPSKIDYSKLANATYNGKKVKFAILRLGYIKNCVKTLDPCFLVHYSKLKSAGVYVGIYLYSFARNEAQAALEADFVIDTIKRYDLEIDYPVYFDYEEKELFALNLGKDKYTSIARTFLERIRENNFYAALYTNPSSLENVFYKDKLLPEFDLWLAHWTYKGIDGKQDDYGQMIWQSTSIGTAADVAADPQRALTVGHLDGVDCPIDINWCYVGYAKKIRELGMNKLITRYNVYGAKTVDDSNLAETEGLLKANGFTVSKKEV